MVHGPDDKGGLSEAEKWRQKNARLMRAFFAGN
jgi:hypothetical protein